MEQVFHCEPRYCPHRVRGYLFRKYDLTLEFVWNSTSTITSIFKLFQCYTLVLYRHKDSDHRAEASIAESAKL